MDSVSDETLRQAAQGNIQAFGSIYRAYAPFVYNVAFRMVQAREDAEEVTQEVFLTVHQKLNSFLFRSSLKTWIYRITVNTSINLLNKRGRQTKGQVEFEGVLDVVAAKDETREQTEREDNEKKIHRLLAQLNPEERACVVLRSVEGLSYMQIAQSLNVNINTVRTRLKRAREKMLKNRTEVMTDEL